MATVPSLIIGGAPRVDLMPRAEIDRRERNALLQRWVRILLLVLLVVVVAIGGAGVLNWTTQQRLAAENQRTQSLLTEIASMKDTRAMLDMKAELGTFRTTAMSAEVDWPTAFAKILSAVPEGVQMTGFELSTGAAPLEDAEPRESDGVSGTLTFSSGTAMQIVDLSRALRGVEGVLDADAYELKSNGDPSNPTYGYVVNVTLDQSVYTGRYSVKEEK